MDKIKDERDNEMECNKRIDQKVAEIKRTLKCFCVPDWNLVQFTSPNWYATLKKCPHLITRDLILQHDEVKKQIAEDDDFDPNSMFEKTCLCILYMRLDKNYDVYSEQVEFIPYNNDTTTDRYIMLNAWGDAYYDIMVTGATYAVMYIGDGKPAFADDGKYGKYEQTIHMDRIGNDKNNDGKSIYTLIDFTADNPLFTATMGSGIKIYTDGNVSAKLSFISYDTRNLYHRLMYLYALSIMPSRRQYVLNGHMWNPSAIVSFDKVKYIDPKIE